ncbi:hypothetical protein ACOMHN_024789 [Nucella lapillus]
MEKEKIRYKTKWRKDKVYEASFGSLITSGARQRWGLSGLGTEGRAAEIYALEDELLTVQRDYQILVKDLEANLKDARAKNEELMSLLKKEKKERRLQETASEGRRSGSPGHNGGATVTHPDLGLDLAMKAAVPSPEEHSRTQSTDAVESEAEGEKTKAGSDRDMKFAEPADRGCHRESFDMFSAAAALASSGAVAGGSPTVRFPAPYLPLIGGEVQ